MGDTRETLQEWEASAWHLPLPIVPCRHRGLRNQARSGYFVTLPRSDAVFGVKGLVMETVTDGDKAYTRPFDNAQDIVKSVIDAYPQAAENCFSGGN